ncbi:MAG: 50S ribosomal protein L30 [Chloroherpetonaceae bacterium]
MSETKKQLKITQIRSAIRCTKKQKATMKSLKLSHPNKSVVRTDNPALRGQLKSVEHLVKIEELN